MKKAKSLLSALLVLLMLVSMSLAGFSVQAAQTETAEVSAAYPTAADDFTWDNATVYFLLTDRFNNGNTSNDHSYNRGLNRDGSVNTAMNNVASFQGGDFKGITQKINEGYFTDLGINAIWVAGWFEQIHGYIVGGDGKKSFAHYAYHGYYGADFSELDKNYGTEAEFKEMIDTAHSKGVRIVLDVVMNHPGYNTIYDMNEYGFGTLQSGWQDVYYNFTGINQSNYHGKIDYNTDSNAWGKWWGADWIRAGLAGYKADGTNDLTNNQVYLPDFKTESTKVLDIPQYLKTKWTKEGTYNTKVNELNSTFSKYSLGSKTVRNYLVAWYTQWVEQYGIDGFRCDTAKHVELDSWKALSNACTKALQNWRKANPNAPGANWDEDFWMTGENFGQGVDYNNYYQNGFDSMINFSFSADSNGNNATGLKRAGDINSLYADYANRINTNDNFNVLTYISSHDTGLCRDDIYYQGSALMLLPGGIQIFYGDETDRQYVDCSIHDHEMRGFMNWNDLKNSSSNQSKVLAHWQKLGTFRNDHVAVGAGAHTKLSATNGAAFARTYSKNGVNDKVVCVIGANNNTSITITLNNTFANGTTLKNAYDGTTAVVTNGKVTFNSGAHGTILLEAAQSGTVDPTPTTPTPTNPTPTTPNPTEPPTEIPSTPAGDTIDLTTIGSQVIVLINSTYQNPYTHTWTDGAGAFDTWPGTQMQAVGNGMYFALVDNNANRIIFNDNGAAQTTDLTIPGNFAIYDMASQSWSGYLSDYVDVTKFPMDPSLIPGNPTDPEPSTPAPTTPAPSNPEGTAEYVLLGDADLSGKVNVKDATSVQKYVAALEELGEKALFAANVDGSETVNVKDATAIQKSVAGMETGYAIGEQVLYKGSAEAPTQKPTEKPTEAPTTPAPTNPDPTEPPTAEIPTEPDPSGDTIDLTTIGSQVIVLMNSTYSNPYTHTWTDGGGAYDTWPGTQMQAVGNGMYFALVDNNANMIIFNDNGGAQTDNLTIPGNFAIYDMASKSWSGYLSDYVDVTKFPLDPSLLPGNPDTPGPEPTPTGNYIYFKDALNWGNVYCHVWTNGGGSAAEWPGLKMESVGNGIYRCEIDSAYNMVVFNNGGNGQQTGDLQIQYDKAYNQQTQQWENI